MRKQVVEPMLILVFLLLVVTFTYQSIKEIEQDSRLTIGKSLHTVLNSANDALNLWISERKNDVEFFAHSPAIIYLAENRLKRSMQDPEALAPTANEKALLTSLHNHVMQMNYRGFSIISSDFINIASMDFSEIGAQNLMVEHHKKKLLRVFNGETVVVSAIKSKSADNGAQPGMFVVTGIRDNQQSIIAALALLIDPVNDFSRITGLGRIGKTGETYAFNRKGLMLSESRFNEQLYQIGLLEPGSKSVLTVRLSAPGGNLLQGFEPDQPLAERPLTLMAKSAINGISGINTQGYEDYRGVHVLGAWRWNNELDIGLTTEIDAEEALDSYFFARNAYLITTISIVIFSLGIMLYLIYIRSSMVTALKQSKTALESTVEHRTQALHNSNLDLQEQVQERIRSEQKLLTAQQELKHLNHQLQDLALTDSLTGIYNRRAFDDYIQAEWRRCRRSESTIGLIFLDIDFFKQFNDTYGHAAGDKCLKTIATALKNGTYLKRPSDFVARYGGEEFVIVLGGSNPTYIESAAKQAIEEIAQLRIQHSAGQVKGVKFVTASAGAAWITPDTQQDYMALIAKADEALYEAKSLGRNCVATSELT